MTKAGVGTNRYSYSFNDPVNLSDPGGNTILEDFFSALGSLFSGSNNSDAGNDEFSDETGDYQAGLDVIENGTVVVGEVAGAVAEDAKQMSETLSNVSCSFSGSGCSANKGHTEGPKEKSEDSGISKTQAAVVAAAGTVAIVKRNKIATWFLNFIKRKPKGLPVPKDLPNFIDEGKQGKHLIGHNNFIPGRSALSLEVDPQKLLSGIHSGEYTIVGHGRRGHPIVEFGKIIGTDGRTGLSTTRGQVHYGNKGAHIVPDIINVD